MIQDRENTHMVRRSTSSLSIRVFRNFNDTFNFFANNKYIGEVWYVVEKINRRI